MKILKELKWQSGLYAVLYVLMGVILLLFPETTATTLCYAVGGGAIVVGVSTVLVYLFRDVTKNAYRNDFVSGLVAVLVGVFILCKVELFISLVPFLLGIAVTVSGFIKLQNCVDMRRMGYGNGLTFFILSFVNILFGILLLADPFQTVIVLFRAMGVGLIFSGVSDLMAIIYMSRRVKNYVENRGIPDGSGKTVVDGEAEEITEER